jgi:hypothetical protein
VVVIVALSAAVVLSVVVVALDIDRAIRIAEAQS